MKLGNRKKDNGIIIYQVLMKFISVRFPKVTILERPTKVALSSAFRRALAFYQQKCDGNTIFK